MAAASLSPAAAAGFGSSFLGGGDRVATPRVPAVRRVAAARPTRPRPRMGNVNEGKGLFAPIVVLVRNVVGRKRFNQLRGKVIALHSQVQTTNRIQLNFFLIYL